MSVYTIHQEFSDQTWFCPNAMTLIAGMPVSVRAAGKFSVCVTDPLALEQAVPAVEQLNRLQPILMDAFSDVLTEETAQIANKMEIPAMKGRFESALREKADGKFRAIGLQVTRLTIEHLQAM